MCMFACPGWVYTDTQTPEEGVRFLRVGVIGGRELLNVGAVYALNPWTSCFPCLPSSSYYGNGVFILSGPLPRAICLHFFCLELVGHLVKNRAPSRWVWLLKKCESWLAAISLWIWLCCGINDTEAKEETHQAPSATRQHLFSLLSHSGETAVCWTGCLSIHSSGILHNGGGLWETNHNTTPVFKKVIKFRQTSKIKLGNQIPRLPSFSF